MKFFPLCSRIKSEFKKRAIQRLYWQNIPEVMSRGCICLIQMLMSIYICSYTQIYVCFCVIHEILINLGILEHHK